MQIRRLHVYQVNLPLHEGSYKWSGGKSVSVFDSTVVGIDTDQGITGWGEVCPLGPFYLPAYAAGVRAGIAELGPHLIGEDPIELGTLNRRMDAALKGEIKDAMSSLTPREAKILNLRYGLKDGREHTLEEVGQKYGLTRERIRQIEKDALRKLRHPSRSRKLRAYL